MDIIGLLAFCVLLAKAQIPFHRNFPAGKVVDTNQNAEVPRSRCFQDSSCCALSATDMLRYMMFVGDFQRFFYR